MRCQISSRMAHEVLKSCKKYIVERVISPSVFCMSEYRRGNFCQKEVRHFEYLLAKHVEKFPSTRKIMVGETVAIKDGRGYHKGVVIDVFNRSYSVKFWILLVDYGNIIETDRTNIYFIKHEDLKENKKLGAFEVSIHGIEPAVMELECDDNFLGGILQKKLSGNWSPRALQFVRDLIEKNPFVFVKTVCCNENSISGEIYFIEKPGTMPVSLGERLCAKGFAMHCKVSPMVLGSLEGLSGTPIEKKIPDNALVRQTGNSEVAQTLKLKNNKRSNIDDSAHGSSSSNLFSVSATSQNKSIDASLDISCDSTYSSSWILKKFNQQKGSTAASPDDSPKNDKFYEPKEVNSSSENFNESVFRAMQRSIDLFDKWKQNKGFNCDSQK